MSRTRYNLKVSQVRKSERTNYKSTASRELVN